MNRKDFKKIKAGRKVKIRTDLISPEIYGSNTFVDGMLDSRGKWFTVRSIGDDPDRYDFRINGSYSIFRFTIEMVETISAFKYGK